MKTCRLIPAVAVVVAIGVFLAAGAFPSAAQERAQAGSPRRTVRVAAASDLRFAFDEIGTRLKATQPDLDLQATYGSSGTFFAQLVNGAPFDLFMSADTDYPTQLAMRGLIVPGSEFTYAAGHLVVWVQSKSPLDVEKAGMQALLDPRVMHVSIANPATAPYGRAAEAALRAAGVYDRVKSRMVLGDNVAQAFQFAQSGAADVAVVALSLALAPTVQGQGRYWQVPPDLYPRLDQGGVILKSAADVDAARRVRAFLMSDDGKSILRRYGFFIAAN